MGPKPESQLDIPQREVNNEYRHTVISTPAPAHKAQCQHALLNSDHQVRSSPTSLLHLCGSVDLFLLQLTSLPSLPTRVDS